MDELPKPKVAAFNCPNCGAGVAPDSPSCRYCGSALALRVCSSCLGAVSVGMRHCPHCGAGIAAEMESPKKDALRCPRCDTNLARVGVGKLSLHSCDRCGGLWVDKDSFQSICTREEEQEAVLGFLPEPESAPVAQERRPKRVYIPCPECGKLMNQKNFSGYSGVVLDWCRDHGSWFDRHELHRIVTFIRNGGLRKAREKEQAKLQEKENRLRMQEFQMAALGRRLDTDMGSFGNKHSDPLLRFLSQMFR